MYKSNFEKEVAKQLRTGGVSFQYESQRVTYLHRVVKGSCKNCGATDVYKERYYTPDFFLSNGVVLEVKGVFTAENRRSVAAAREQGMDIRMVFYHNNKLNKARENRYSDWCESKGIPYCFREVPKGWMLPTPTSENHLIPVTTRKKKKTPARKPVRSRVTRSKRSKKSASNH